MTHHLEHEWASQLKQGRRHSSLPLSIRKKNTTTKLEIKKQMFLDIATKHTNTEEVQHAFTELLELRARLCALALEEEKEFLGFLSDYHIEQHIESYDNDCKELKRVFHALINRSS